MLVLMKQFDFLVLGAGWGGLTVASLLARSGHTVCVLEAQDRAGGCGQSFELDGFTFCAEMQYLMGCGPGGAVHDWLVALELQDVVRFNALDPEGYDRIVFPDLRFRIPNDPHRLQEELKRTFPEETEKIDQLFVVMFEIAAEINGRAFDARHLLTEPFRFKSTVLYGPWSVAHVFDYFGLSPQLRAVLAGQCGDIGLGPRDEPFFCLVSVLFGYCESAHFPSKGMGHFVESIVDCIRRSGGEVHFDARVTEIVKDGDLIAHVETTGGSFAGARVVSDIDPAQTLAMIEGTTPPRYEQSASCFTIFVGADIDLAEHGFGRSNVWCFPEFDLDAAIDRSIKENSYADPFFFLSTPSLCADPGVLAPPGCTTVQINVGSSFEFFEQAMQNGTHASEKARVTAEILAAVERRLIPGFTAHARVLEAWSPVDLARHTGLARGGMYGARLDFLNRVIHRVASTTDYPNLFLTGATAGGPGLAGVVAAGTRLVAELTAPSAEGEDPPAQQSPDA